MKISKQGYKRNSPDRGAESLRIPSNQITMEGVDHDVLGTDNLGVTKLMHPNMNYTFPGDYVDEQPLAKSGIHIKPENKGKFTAYKKRTGKTTEEALHSKDSHVRQMANFARNAKKWNHAQDGVKLPPDYLKGMMATGWKPPTAQPQIENIPLPTHAEYRERELDKQYPWRMSTQQQADMFTKEFGYGHRDDKIQKKNDWISPALLAVDMLTPERDKIKDPVVRPLQTYNEHPYGTGSQAIMQDGGSLQAANLEAKRFAKSRGLLIGDDAHVDKIPPYIDSSTGKPYKPMPTRPLSYTVPNDIQLSDIKSEQGKYWYTDTHTGDVVDVDPSVLNLKRFKGQKVLQNGGVMPGRLDGSSYKKSKKMKAGGDFPYNPLLTDSHDGKKIPVVYEHGGTYDVSDDEIKRLIAAGYELKIQ